MIKVRKEVRPEFKYDLELIGPPEKPVFFDIETTGLSPKNSSLYLIGVLFFDEGSWIFEQYFAEDPLEEPLLLDAFFELLGKKRRLYGSTILIHYNGDMFDIPFLKSCISGYRLPHDFSFFISLDIFRKVKPLKAFLGLENCKLKTVERFLGEDREDEYNGGELIEVYLRYLKLGRDKGQELLRLLLLHNEEDILNMPSVLCILAYDDLFSAKHRLISSDIVDLSKLGLSKGGHVLDLNYSLTSTLPVPLYFSFGSFNLGLSEKKLNITADMREGELKYFFDNYKEYYYLPFEDYAVHRSLGEFVDKKARVKACAKNCYMKKEGLFFPQPSEILKPGFYEEYKGKDIYALYENDPFSDPGFASEYAHEVLKLAASNMKAKE